MKYSTLQYRAVFSLTRDAMSKGKIAKEQFCIPIEVLRDLCKTYLAPVGLRLKEGKSMKGTVSIERNDVDAKS
jgi:hypothetical protein